MLAMAHPRPSPLWHQRTSYSSKCLLLCWGNAFLVRDWRVKNLKAWKNVETSGCWLRLLSHEMLENILLLLCFTCTLWTRNSYLYVLCALPRWLLSSTFPSLAGLLGGRQSMIYWHILAMIGYGWRLTQHTSISNQGNSPHVTCPVPVLSSCPFQSFLIFITRIQTSWLGVKLHTFLRSHSKVGLVKHRETSPETLRDSRLWNNGRESWQLVTNVFQGWANPIHFSRCYNVV